MYLTRTYFLLWAVSTVSGDAIFDGDYSIQVLNGSPQPLEILWLQNQSSNGTVGSRSIRVVEREDSYIMNVGVTNIFRFSCRECDHLQSFQHKGGSGLNLVVLSPSSVIHHFSMDDLHNIARKTVVKCKQMQQQRSLSSCIRRSRPRIPEMDMEFPENVYEIMHRHLYRFTKPPSLLNGPLDDFKDQMVVINGASEPLRLVWSWQWEHENLTASQDIHEIATLPAALAPNEAYVRLRPLSNHVFRVESRGKNSCPFSYAGELQLVVVGKLSANTSALEFEIVSETQLKTLLGEMALVCAKKVAAPQNNAQWSEESRKQWLECLQVEAVFPITGVGVPPYLVSRLFEALWLDENHLRLCNHQEESTFISSSNISIDDNTLRVDVLRQEPLVASIYDLVSHEECAKLRARAGNVLAQTPVGRGEYHRFDLRERRTLDATLLVDWQDESSITTQVSHRLFKLVEETTGYKLSPRGQEPLQWLFYKPGFEFRPHCDGQCNRSTVEMGNRILTTLLYCVVAEEGGATVFPRDGLKFTPREGSVLLFTYNPDPDGLSEHAACPVLKGEKATLTQWYRDGTSEHKTYEDFEQSEL